LKADTGAGDNFLLVENWKKLGLLTLQSATHHQIDTMGTCELKTKFRDQPGKKLHFVINKIPSLYWREMEFNYEYLWIP